MKSLKKYAEVAIQSVLVAGIVAVFIIIHRATPIEVREQVYRFMFGDRLIEIVKAFPDVGTSVLNSLLNQPPDFIYIECGVFLEFISILILTRPNKLTPRERPD